MQYTQHYDARFAAKDDDVTVNPMKAQFRLSHVFETVAHSFQLNEHIERREDAVLYPVRNSIAGLLLQIDSDFVEIPQGSRCDEEFSHDNAPHASPLDANGPRHRTWFRHARPLPILRRLLPVARRYPIPRSQHRLG